MTAFAIAAAYRAQTHCRMKAVRIVGRMGVVTVLGH